MKLQKAIIRPGIVLKVEKDENGNFNGNIKASAPGLFSYMDSDEDYAKLPPIMAWQLGSNCNSFSSPKENDDVWIMNFEDNPQQLYWFRKDRITNNKNLCTESNNSNIPFTEENVEVLCNREVGGEWMTIYFSDGSGWIIGKGDSTINIKPDGSIVLDTNNKNCAIDICAQGVYLGGKHDDSEFHPVAYADETQKVLYAILAALKLVQQVSMVNPYTMAIGTALSTQLGSISTKISDISSENVYTT